MAVPARAPPGRRPCSGPAPCRRRRRPRTGPAAAPPPRSPAPPPCSPPRAPVCPQSAPCSVGSGSQQHVSFDHGCERGMTYGGRIHAAMTEAKDTCTVRSSSRDGQGLQQASCLGPCGSPDRAVTSIGPAEHASRHGQRPGSRLGTPGTTWGQSYQHRRTRRVRRLMAARWGTQANATQAPSPQGPYKHQICRIARRQLGNRQERPTAQVLFTLTATSSLVFLDRASRTVPNAPATRKLQACRIILSAATASYWWQLRVAIHNRTGTPRGWRTSAHGLSGAIVLLQAVGPA